MASDTVTLILIDDEDLSVHDDLRECPWGAECAVCGSTVLCALTEAGQVYEGEDAVCSWCGAVDHWSVDTIEEPPLALLAYTPDEGSEVRVLRRIFETTGRQEWTERAMGVDAGSVFYLVQDGDTVCALLDRQEAPDAD